MIQITFTFTFISNQSFSKDSPKSRLIRDRVSSSALAHCGSSRICVAKRQAGQELMIGMLLAHWSMALVGSAWPHATTPRIRSASVRRVLLCAQELTPEAQFIAEVHRSITKGSFVKLTLTGNDGSNSTDGKSVLSRLTRIEGRLVNLKQRTKLQLTHKYEHRDTCTNIELSEVPSKLAPLLSAGAFRNGRLMAAEADFSLESRKRGRVLHRLKPTTSAKPLLPLSHDRVKPLAGAIDDDFLQALGVTGSDGKPKAGKADKLRQIRKFVETLSALVRRGLSAEMSVEDGDEGSGLGNEGRSRRSGLGLSATEGVEDGEGMEDGEDVEDDDVGSGLGIDGQSRRSQLGGGQRLRIVDAGCGRGYLTFAAHRFFASKVSENE